MRVKGVYVELCEHLIKSAVASSQSETQRSNVELASDEFAAKRTRKKLSDIKGTIEFADGYDYKSMRKYKGDDFE